MHRLHSAAYTYRVAEVVPPVDDVVAVGADLVAQDVGGDQLEGEGLDLRDPVPRVVVDVCLQLLHRGRGDTAGTGTNWGCGGRSKTSSAC